MFEQMGHVASELSRARSWYERHDQTAYRRCLDRAVELIDLTKNDARWKARLKEICRLREILADQYEVVKQYQVSLQDLEHYCMAFAVALRRKL